MFCFSPPATAAAEVAELMKRLRTGWPEFHSRHIYHFANTSVSVVGLFLLSCLFGTEMYFPQEDSDGNLTCHFHLLPRLRIYETLL
jgi:hypothetical protein